MNHKHVSLLLLVPTLLVGCARNDYHGMDPKTYNEVLYPKTNIVKHNSIYQSFFFDEMSPRFEVDMIQALDEFLAHTYPESVQRLKLDFGARDADREIYITRLLRARGFKKSSMQFDVGESMHPDEVIVTMDYSFVETPRCPNWQKSSSTNYSNTNHSNFGCSTQTNFARQVANPHDLVQSGTSRVTADAARNSTAIGAYRTGAAAGSSSGEAASEE